ncbi:MAG: type II 3-dehydroquinate dehydratase [Clostridia bacterium]|nr:type II 3-dehydroquinate dehydratase [Clostridia bacterium]MBO7177842.1 type II 3-dehydroquinate dehydratase [Clostridia bacterium]
MKKILVLNGPNLNMLGIREPLIYGKRDYQDLYEFIIFNAKKLGLSATVMQSNHEGELVTWIQDAYQNYDGIIINAGAYTHTSVAILDALKTVGIPTVEVHLTNINEREEFRKFSYISLYAEQVIVGKGFNGYLEALEYFVPEE